MTQQTLFSVTEVTWNNGGGDKFTMIYIILFIKILSPKIE